MAIALGAGRVTIGAGFWIAPGLSARVLGFPDIDGRTLILARLAATRDLVLGGWQLGSLDNPARLRTASAAGAIADAGDALAFALALRSEDRATRRAGLRGLAAAAPAAIAGAGLASSIGRGRRNSE
jgi:hypothetical protein